MRTASTDAQVCLLQNAIDHLSLQHLRKLFRIETLLPLFSAFRTRYLRSNQPNNPKATAEVAKWWQQHRTRLVSTHDKYYTQSIPTLRPTVHKIDFLIDSHPAKDIQFYPCDWIRLFVHDFIPSEQLQKIIIDYHVMFTHGRAKNQDWHCDNLDSVRHNKLYYTIVLL